MLRIAIKYNDFIIDKKPLTVIRERPSGQISIEIRQINGNSLLISD